MSQTKKQKSPVFTSRSGALLKAAKGKIRPGDKVVDLGAGHEAVLCRELSKDFPTCTIIAVEPFVEVSAPHGVEVVKGDVTALEEGSVDVILFNSPNTPERYLDPEDGSYYQHAGGPNGYDFLHDVLEASPPRLGPGGRLIFICPNFTVLPDMDLSRLEVLSRYDETFDLLASRVPVKPSMEEEYRDFLRGRLEARNSFWTELGVPSKPGSVTAMVLCFTV